MNPLYLLRSFVLAALVACPLAAQPVVIRLGTILPSGTAQELILRELAEQWRNDSRGTVKLVLYPDGRLGGEAEMVKKIRIQQLNAGLLSAVGLAEIEPGARGLQFMPLMFRSWAEVDYAREHVRPLLEARLRAKGCEVLFWADAGWVRFFTSTPAIRPDDIRRTKLFAWAGDSAQIGLMRDMGCQPVALETSDILLGLNTGMVNAVPVPPMIALAGQVYRPAPHMLEMDWAPIVGAAVVRSDAWDKIPPDVRTRLKADAEVIGERIRARGRLEHDEAITAMAKHGLQSHPLTPEAAAEWQQVAVDLYPRIRGPVVPADIFDAVETSLREFRASSAASSP